jgi:hypothetical protein
MSLPEDVFATLDPATQALLQRHPLYPLLVELSACLCARVGADSCFCGILMGDDLPVEFAGECENDGTAYVRLVTAYPSTVIFPEPDALMSEGTLRAWQVAVGILRNAGWPEDPSEFDPMDAQRFALVQMADQQATWEAIACCFGERYDDIDVSGAVFTTFPVQGNVGGGEWLLTIRQPF